MMGTAERVIHDACGTGDEITTCGQCLGEWCDRCDPAHGPLCPWCHGYGYSTAAIREPRYRQANHVLHNGGHPIQCGPDYSVEGRATAGNNRRVHLIRYGMPDHFVTLCGVHTPRRPQTTQDPLPKCARCFGGAS